MPLHFYEGPSFSGRSEALREFAWQGGARDRGCYVHPMLDMNLSGLAETVRGEVYLHAGPTSAASSRGSSHSAWSLIDDLPPTRTLRSLSGGETARLVLACALASMPSRLALDCTLEQLDSQNRHRVLADFLMPVSKTIDLRIADNDGSDVADAADVRRSFEPHATTDLNGPLVEFAKALVSRSVQAPSLELDGLTFRYRGSRQAIFNRTSFHFRPGRPYLLKAPNGSGKSTLARLLLGVLRPDGGAIKVDGVSVGDSGPEKNLVFYAFQNPIIQMVSSGTLAYLLLLEKKARERDTWLRGSIGVDAKAALAGFGLESFQEDEPFDLPFVALKRLSISASVVSRSPWLFFDEPALSSDLEGRNALGCLFNALCELGFGVIIVSHGREFDRLPGAYPITIRDGKLEGG